MARDILGEFGSDAHKSQAGRASHGGHMPVRDVHNYCPPKGPTNIGDPHGPGLHGNNYGHGQQHHPTREGGNAGISHEKHPHGSQK